MAVNWEGEIKRLSEFLNERFGDMRGDDEATADFAMRLLEPSHPFVSDGFNSTGCVECGLPRRAHAS